MRGRSLVLSIVTMLVAVLGLASPAHANGPDVQITCRSQSNIVNCFATVTPDPAGGAIQEFIWLVGAKVQPSKTGFLTFRCTTNIFGDTDASVSLRVRQAGVAEGSKLGEKVTCDDPEPRLRQILPIFCQTLPTAGLPGGLYFLCDILWRNDGSAMTVQWLSPGAPRQPAVSTFPAERRSYATFDCNVYNGGPDYTFTAFVRVTDALGSMTTPLTIPCGW